MSRRAEREEAAHLQYETEHTQPPKARSVVVYMVVLVAAAFCLLLLAYFMQERTASTVEGLSQSMNSFQTIDQLVEDNRALRDEVDRLEAENAALADQLAEAKQAADDWEAMYDSRTNDLQRELVRADALANLWTADQLYRARQYKDCAESLVNFNEEAMGILPPEALSRALEICQGLTDRGLLDGEQVTSLKYYIARQDISPEE